MKIEKKPSGIIFDLDGTLADTIPQLALAAKLSCEAAGVKAPTVDEAKSYVGNGVKLLLSRCIAGRREATAEDVDPALLSLVREHFNHFYSEGLARNYSVYSGVWEGLEYFKSQDIKLAVCTNKPQMFAVPLLKLMGISDFFDFILGGEVLAQRKPDPAPILYVCGRLGLLPSECVMVGDSENDVLGGQRAQMPSVFLSYGYFCGDPATMHPDHKFDDFGEFTALISSFSKR